MALIKPPGLFSTVPFSQDSFTWFSVNSKINTCNFSFLTETIHKINQSLTGISRFQSRNHAKLPDEIHTLQPNIPINVAKFRSATSASRVLKCFRLRATITWVLALNLLQKPGLHATPCFLIQILDSLNLSWAILMFVTSSNGWSPHWRN